MLQLPLIQCRVQKRKLRAARTGCLGHLFGTHHARMRFQVLRFPSPKKFMHPITATFAGIFPRICSSKQSCHGPCCGALAFNLQILNAYVGICSSLSLSIYCLSLCLSINLFIYLSLYLYQSIHLSTYPMFYLLIDRSIYVLYLFIYLQIYLIQCNIIVFCFF